jgi:small GTP-binding protein
MLARPLYYRSKFYYRTKIRYKSGYFTYQSIPTIGCDFVEKIENIDNRNIKVKVWDTSGQERYKSLTRNFYNQADGVVVVYDVTDRGSFNKVKGWIESVLENKDDINMVLLGNKIDLESRREVLVNEGEQLAFKNNNIAFFETSAKDNINIETSINCLVKDVLETNSRRSRGQSLPTNPSTSRCFCF